MAAPIEANDPMSFALRYAGIGLRVVPIRPGSKRPELPAWQDAATTDRATIESWWTGLYRGHGVGLALGELDDLSIRPTYIFAVDIDMHGIDGEAMFADLVAENTELPETVEAITGGGGRHLLFSSPTEVRNGRLTDGVDIRGAGGQIVVEPTVHPSGGTYSWVDGQAPWEHDIAPAPEWLIERLTAANPEPRPTPSAPSVDVGDRPGDLWAAQTTWEQLLTRFGWTFGYTHDGVDYWIRPGKTAREGISASLGYGGYDQLKVFTSAVPQLKIDKTYSKIGFLAAMLFDGDISAAASALAREGHGAPDPMDWFDNIVAAVPLAVDPPASSAPEGDGGWPIATTTEIDAVLSGDYEPPVPELMFRTDGVGMLYRGRVHSLAGEPGGGKTWIALHAGAEVLAAGGIVVLIDYEDRLDTAVRRLVALGAAPKDIRRGLRYISPTFAIRGGHVPTNVTAETAGAELVIVDSMGEALAHSELDQNNDGEVRAWMAATARRLADGGASVLILDHVTKDSEHRGRWAIGSQRKLAAIDGIAYMMVTIAAATKETVGRAAIKCSKDRLGNFQHGSTVAEVTLTPIGDGMEILLAPPAVTGEDGEQYLTGYMEKISRFLEGMGEPMSGRAITATVEGRAEFVRTALRQLIERGNVTTEPGPRGSTLHGVSTPFREFDLVAMDQESTASHRVPTASRTRSNPTESTASRVPTLREGRGRSRDEVLTGSLEISDRVPDAVDEERDWI